MASIFALEQYVEQKNTWRSLFKEQPLSLLSASDRQTIARMLESDLSPENLTCDGELRGPALRTKASWLNRVALELSDIDPTVQFYDHSL